MGRRTFGGMDICEIFTHWHAGRSRNEIAGSLGLSRNTVRKYVAAAEAAGMVPGGPAVSQEEWARLAREWVPELADTRLRQGTWAAVGEDPDYLGAQVGARVTVAPLHQRVRDERGTGGAGSVCRAGCPPAWSPTISRPGWTGRTCMTRGSTAPTPSWPPITAA